MSFRVRFSQDRPDIAYVPAQQKTTGLANDLFKLPLPQLTHEASIQMDIHTAASIGEADIIKDLLRNGFPVNKPNNSGWTALLYAAYLGHTGTCTLLLDNGAQVDAANLKGQTALMLASACGNLSVVKVLLGKGANAGRKDNGGRQSLHYAASCSQNAVVDLLLSAGCDPNALDSTGMTPVLEACQAAHELTLDSLLKNGGDPFLKNSRGEDGEQLATDAEKVLQLIRNCRQRGGVVIEPSRPRQIESLAELLEAMDLERYLPKFEKEHIDLKLFFSLTDKDLDDMGVAYGPKKRMRAVIDRYCNTGVVAVDTPIPSAAPPYAPGPSDGRVPMVAGMPADQFSFARSILESTHLLATEAMESLGADETSDRLRPLLTGIKDGLEQVIARMHKTV